MSETNKKKSVTFWQFFRLVFALFSLYLMGDAFYRWDAFKFYGTFLEFMPSVALASIVVSLVAFLAAFTAWIFFTLAEHICRSFGLQIRTEHLLVYAVIMISMVFLAWIWKHYVWSNAEVSMALKLIVVTAVAGLALIPGWLIRKKAYVIVSTVQERITPLVWLFGIFVLASIPLVSYLTWGTSSSEPVKRVERSDLTPGIKKKNILLVTFDAMSARNMSVYGYDRPTTPFISKWAKTAALFSMAEASSNYTGPTTASLMTGKDVWTHRRYNHEKAAQPIKSDVENLALELKKNGYYNYALIMNVIASVDALGIAGSIDVAPMASEFADIATVQGFIETHLDKLFGSKLKIHNWIGQDDFILSTLMRLLPQKVYTTEYPAENAFNMFLQSVDKDLQEPFFAWIHILPPHAPYLAPEPYSGMFNPTSEMREFNAQEKFRTVEVRENTELHQNFSDRIMRKILLLRDFYDEFIAYCDKQFEVFVEKVEKRDWSDHTVIILSADHGESFRKEYFYHGGPYLYEQVTHIPLIIKEPGQTNERVISKITEQIDIPATILDFANAPIPSWMHGRSLIPLLRGDKVEPHPVISMNLQDNSSKGPIKKGTFAVWDGDYKLVHYLVEDKSLLFNLSKDPEELTNLIEIEPKVGEKLLSIIKNRLEEANRNITAEEAD